MAKKYPKKVTKWTYNTLFSLVLGHFGTPKPTFKLAECHFLLDCPIYTSDILDPLPSQVAWNGMSFIVAGSDFKDTLMYDCSRGSTTVNWSFRDRLTRSRRKECYAAAAYFLSSQPRLEQFLSQLNLTSLHPVFQAKTLDLKCNAFFAWKKKLISPLRRCRRRHHPAAKFNRGLTMNQIQVSSRRRAS